MHLSPYYPSQHASTVLCWAVAIGSYVMAILWIVPLDTGPRVATALLGLWLSVTALVQYAGMRASRRSAVTLERIPITFGRSTGEFILRKFDEGLRVAVQSRDRVVAEVIARDEGDELVIDFDGQIDDVDAFGAAIGKAIELVAVAERSRVLKILTTRRKPAPPAVDGDPR